MADYGRFAPAQIDFSQIDPLGSYERGASFSRQNALRNLMGTPEAQDMIKQGNFRGLAALAYRIDPDYGRKLLQGELSGGSPYGANFYYGKRTDPNTGVESYVLMAPNRDRGTLSEAPLPEGVEVVAPQTWQQGPQGAFPVPSRGGASPMATRPPAAAMPIGPQGQPMPPQEGDTGIPQSAPPAVAGEQPVFNTPQAQPQPLPPGTPPGYSPTPSPVAPAGPPYPTIDSAKFQAEQAAKAEKKGESRRQQLRSADVVLRQIDRVRAAIASDPLVPNTGTVGGLTQNIPGTPAHALQQLIEPIAANISFDRLNELRQASPTGAALGPVSDFENRRLAAVYGSMLVSQPGPQLDQAMKDFEAVYQEIIHGPKWREVVGQQKEAPGQDDPMGLFR